MKSEIIDQALVFRFAERLDTVTAMSLQKEIVDAIAAADQSLKVKFDFAGVEYISSGFLRILMVVVRMKDKDFSIFNTGPAVREILTIAGLDRRIHIE